jgi:hypothetical protein
MLKAEYHGGDYLHHNAAGFELTADVIPLNFFSKFKILPGGGLHPPHAKVGLYLFIPYRAIQYIKNLSQRQRESGISWTQ